MNTLPIVGCKAEVDTVIYELLKQGPLQVGPIAQWSRGETIYLRGRYKTRSQYNFMTPIRWGTEKRHGFFGKGLTEIGRHEPVDHLPYVK